jgi:hypothetical protein
VRRALLLLLEVTGLSHLVLDGVARPHAQDVERTGLSFSVSTLGLPELLDDS